MTPNIYTYVTHVVVVVAATHVVVGVTHIVVVVFVVVVVTPVVAVVVTYSVVPFLQIQFPNSDPPIGLSLVETH